MNRSDLAPENRPATLFGKFYEKLEAIMSKLYIVLEFWQFLKVSKKWWLVPIVIFLMLFGIVIILAKGSALAPFIYTLF